MCSGIVQNAVKLTKRATFSLRAMFRKKEEVPAAFDFLSPPKEEKRGKVCPVPSA